MGAGGSRLVEGGRPPGLRRMRWAVRLWATA